MKNITLKYHWEMDFTWLLSVNIAGELLAGYLWWRIAPLSDFQLNMIIFSVFIGYIGVSLLCLVGMVKRKSAMKARLYIGEKVVAQDYRGCILNNCVMWKTSRSPMQYVFGICDLFLVDITGKKIKIKNISCQVERYLI